MLLKGCKTDLLLAQCTIASGQIVPFSLISYIYIFNDKPNIVSEAVYLSPLHNFDELFCIYVFGLWETLCGLAGGCCPCLAPAELCLRGLNPKGHHMPLRAQHSLSSPAIAAALPVTGILTVSCSLLCEQIATFRKHSVLIHAELVSPGLRLQC